MSEDDALATLAAAVDAGVTFLDTADVYGDGRSEALIGRFIRESRPRGVTVATKMGRRANPHEAAAYNADAFRDWTDRSRTNLGVDTLDLVQLHCPPTSVYGDDAVFDVLDEMVDEGRMSAYGVSVETCEEALTAIARPNVATVQIILNAFRRKPLEQVLPAALEAGVGIIARVPLASGLLTGKYDESTTFAADDHRSYNRSGEAFDVGETFSGVPYDVGLAAAREVSALAPSDLTTAQLALRWIVDQPGVSAVIPGARTPEQARANAVAGTIDPLPPATLAALERIYDERVREHVHARW